MDPEIVEAPPPAPKPKNKGGRPRKHKLAPRVPFAMRAQAQEAPKAQPAPSAGIFEGITGGANGDCCAGCEATLCVITGDNICGHPNKNGLHAKHKMQPTVMRRYNEAKRILNHQRAAAIADA